MRRKSGPRKICSFAVFRLLDNKPNNKPKILILQCNYGNHPTGDIKDRVDLGTKGHVNGAVA